jgi:hypothetical protein
VHQEEFDDKQACNDQTHDAESLSRFTDQIVREPSRDRRIDQRHGSAAAPSDQEARIGSCGPAAARLHLGGGPPGGPSGPGPNSPGGGPGGLGCLRRISSAFLRCSGVNTESS